MKSKSIENNFPAKILLFGEYTVLSGFSALAIPFTHFSGSWQSKSISDPTLLDWIYKMRQLPQNLSSYLLLNEFEQEVQTGLHFISDIPLGCGLGSSGALTAALFSRFGKDLDGLSLENFRVLLSQAESCFHGKSSGIDPLVSYTRKAIRYQLDIGPQYVQIDEHNLNFYLINSNQPRETKTLVAHFNILKEKDEGFREAMNQLGNLQTEAIINFLDGDTQLLWELAIQISIIQFEYLNWLIPDSIKPLFEEGIESKKFVMKLCGAGGGGYFIRINSPESTSISTDYLPNSEWIPISF